MFAIFTKNPTKKLTKIRDAKLEQAMHAQRNGDIKSYSILTFEADEIHKEILEIQAKSKSSAG